MRRVNLPSTHEITKTIFYILLGIAIVVTVWALPLPLQHAESKPTDFEVQAIVFDFGSVPKYTCLGVYKITYYCPCKICCGKESGITASMTKATINHTVAVDPDKIPLGTQLLINGILYTAEDKGGAIKGNRIDIFVATHEEAIALGVDYYAVDRFDGMIYWKELK